MTSPATHDETREYLAEHALLWPAAAGRADFLPGDDAGRRCRSGRLLLADKDRLSLSPDGHGGMLAALDTSGALADMTGAAEFASCSISRSTIRWCRSAIQNSWAITCWPAPKCRRRWCASAACASKWATS